MTRPPLEVLKKRIHVGCGPAALKAEWLNVDIRNFPGVDQVFDITQPWEGLGGVEYVYGEHFLEHLTLDQALAFLSRAHGAMVETGRIRLSTPALEWVIATHFDPAQTDANKMIAQTLGINRAFHGWGHKFLWSRIMLQTALQESGFRNVTFHKYGESDDKFLRGIEEHGGYKEQQGFPSTWIVEAMNDPDAKLDAAFREVAERDFVRYVRSGH